MAADRRSSARATTDTVGPSADAPADKALDRIRKLFAKAESVAGTPEAEVLLERAYALLAKYGVDEALPGPHRTATLRR